MRCEPSHALLPALRISGGIDAVIIRPLMAILGTVDQTRTLCYA